MGSGYLVMKGVEKEKIIPTFSVGDYLLLLCFTCGYNLPGVRVSHAKTFLIVSCT